MRVEKRTFWKIRLFRGKRRIFFHFKWQRLLHQCKWNQTFFAACSILLHGNRKWPILCSLLDYRYEKQNEYFFGKCPNLVCILTTSSILEQGGVASSTIVPSTWASTDKRGSGFKSQTWYFSQCRHFQKLASLFHWRLPSCSTCALRLAGDQYRVYLRPAPPLAKASWDRLQLTYHPNEDKRLWIELPHTRGSPTFCANW